MKYDFLGLPKEFEVGKHIREQFLRSGTTTPGRKRLIEERVTDIELLYDLKFIDGSEIIVIIASIDKSVDDWTEKNVALAIASSFPHHSMVIVCNGSGANIFTFEEKRQSRNNDRMSIEKVYKSIHFYIGNIDDEVLQLIDTIRKEYEENKTAAFVCDKWNKAIDAHWKKHFHNKWLNDNCFVEHNGGLSIDINKMIEEQKKEDEWFHSVNKYLDDVEEKRNQEYASRYWWYESDV